MSFLPNLDFSLPLFLLSLLILPHFLLPYLVLLPLIYLLLRLLLCFRSRLLVSNASLPDMTLEVFSYYTSVLFSPNHHT